MTNASSISLATSTKQQGEDEKFCSLGLCLHLESFPMKMVGEIFGEARNILPNPLCQSLCVNAIMLKAKKK